MKQMKKKNLHTLHVLMVKTFKIASGAKCDYCQLSLALQEYSKNGGSPENTCCLR